MTDPLARIDRLERRLSLVEKRLGLASPAPLDFANLDHVAVAEMADNGFASSRTLDDARDQGRLRRERMQQLINRTATPPMTPPPLPDAATPASAPAEEIDLHLEENVIPVSPPAAPASFALPELHYEPRPVPSVGPPKQSPLEQTIGLKLAGWVGAIVLVIGAGLGIKYAYDRGFFAGVHPAMWLSLLYTGGFALLAAGELVYRRVNKISATGLFGAGVATLFLVSYAGHGYYGLYQRETAFTLMALSTLVGAGVAMRGRLVSIAVLSLLGGLIAPIVLAGDSDLVTPFLAYLLMLQVVALTLSWWGGTARWWTLRGLSLAGTSIWMSAVLWRAQPWGVPMCFALLYGALYQFEVVLSAFRGRVLNSADDHVHAGAGVTFSALVAGALTGAMLWIFSGTTPTVRGGWVAGFSAITVLASLILPRLAKDWRILALAFGYRVQAAILLLIAVPVALSGASISVGWSAVALALAAIGAKLNDRHARRAAILGWALAVLNLMIWTTNDPTVAATREIWFTILGTGIRAWAVIGVALVAVGHVIARMLTAHERNESNALNFAATGLFAVVAIAALPPIGATATLLTYAWLLVGLDTISTHVRFAKPATVILALATAKWFVTDTLGGRLSEAWPQADYLPLLNPLTLTAVALTASLALFDRIYRRDVTRDESSRLRMLLAAVFVIVWAGTFEIDRLVAGGAFPGVAVWPAWQLRHFAWSALWSAGATAVIAGAMLRDDTSLRRLPMLRMLAALPVLLAAKYLVIDTLMFRLDSNPARATVFANLQTFAGTILIAALVLVRHWHEDGRLRRVAGALAVVMLLWVGSFEIDRALFMMPTAKQVALSVFWSAFAIGSVAAGFLIRTAGLRYFGLSLFALTLVKIGIVDLQNAETGYRILSFIGLGGLLLATSVIYGKLSPVLLGEMSAEPAR